VRQRWHRLGRRRQAGDGQGRWAAEEEGGGSSHASHRWKEQPHIVRRMMTGQSRVMVNARQVTP
jgi:hypothetical protein